MYYLEDLKSQQLYEMNKRRCLAEFYINEEDGLFVKKIIYGLRKTLDRIRLQIRRKYYDKSTLGYEDKIPIRNYLVSKIPKTVVYTAVLGEYDDLHEPFYTNEKYDFVLITDNENMINKESAWKLLKLSNIKDMPKGLSSIQLNRWLKMNPHLLFPEYDVSIYIDGHVNIVTDMMPVVLDFYESKRVIGIHLHSNRKKIITEINTLLYCGKISVEDEKKAIAQYERYKANGFNDSIHLLEATIIIRKHNDTLCKDIMQAWWEEFITGVQRDQISLPYVIWSLGLNMSDIYILGDNEYSNPRFYISKHRPNNTL